MYEHFTFNYTYLHILMYMLAYILMYRKYVYGKNRAGPFMYRVFLTTSNCLAWHGRIKCVKNVNASQNLLKCQRKTCAITQQFIAPVACLICIIYTYIEDSSQYTVIDRWVITQVWWQNNCKLWLASSNLTFMVIPSRERYFLAFPRLSCFFPYIPVHIYVNIKGV